VNPNDQSIITYISEDRKASFDVKQDQETVWLTQAQMAKLFDKSRSTINEHIKNIFSEDELIKDIVARKFGNSENSKATTKPTNYYNLDVIISVGYRVKSKRGTQFRQWATKILSDKLLKSKEQVNASIYIHAPITIHTQNIKGNKVSTSFSYIEKEFSEQKTNLIDLLNSVLQEVHDHPVLKNSIHQYQSDIEKSAPGQSVPNRIVHFIKDLGDPSSMTHQILNGAGVGKNVIKKCFDLGRTLLNVLTSL